MVIVLFYQNEKIEYIVKCLIFILNVTLLILFYSKNILSGKWTFYAFVLNTHIICFIKILPTDEILWDCFSYMVVHITFHYMLFKISNAFKGIVFILIFKLSWFKTRCAVEYFYELKKIGHIAVDTDWRVQDHIMYTRVNG